MKFNESHYLNGMPANEDGYSLQLEKGISLIFNQEQFKNLCIAAGEKNESDLQRIQVATEKFDIKREKMNILIKGMVSLFYEQSDEMLFLRDLKEIDFQKMKDLIDINSELLGIE